MSSALPTFGEALSNKGTTSRTWYKFWSDVWKGEHPASTMTVTPTASPFSFQANWRGFMIIQGGTVSLIQFSRDGVTNINTGITSGCVPLSFGDLVIVTYSSAPTMTWVPQ